MKPDDGRWDLARLSPSDAPELQHALDALRQQRPDSRQLGALAASLSQLGISVAPAQQATAGTAPSTLRLKLILGAGVVGPLTLALLLWRAPAPRVPAPAAVVATAMSAAQAGAKSVAASQAFAPSSKREGGPPANSAASNPAPPSASPSSLEESAATQADRVPKSQAGPTSVRSAARVAVAPTVSAESAHSPVVPDRASLQSTAQGVVARPTEIALLRDARLALASNPAEALALTEQHRASFARGAMIQERELIAISALARLGRHTAVLTRAAQFERDFPSSPYRKQVSALAQ